ncbi:MAG: redoxin domain-containing protein, partial [Planctomycetes bacterium]|nr:redoxin domain-containing protein [Planctomycetota bacterium]
YLAAKDPLNRWPLILVGLVGKVLGPIGFVFAATWCEFPWRAGWTIVTNDLIWWIPFASILIHVVRIRDEQRTIAESLNLEQVLRETIATTGESLLDISHKQDMLIVCLRHSGCTFCREALSDLSLQKPAIEKANVRPIVVHMGNVSDGDQLARQYCLEDVLFISDPTRRIYRALDLKLGTLSQLIGPRTFWRALIGGPVFRHGFGAFKGNGFQMPGTFLIRNGHVINAFRNESPADRPNYTTLATCEISQTPT